MQAFIILTFKESFSNKSMQLFKLFLHIKFWWICFSAMMSFFYALPFYWSQMFWAGPNLLCQPKIYLPIVAVTNILWQTKRWFEFSKIVFCASTTVFKEALNSVKFLGWLKKFGPAQNILEAVKGQGISFLSKETSL